MTQINKALATIQQELKAPKGQRNNFGNYNYRSCEDILNAVKPLLGEASLTIEDEIVMVGDRFYVKATATFALGEELITTSAYAREPLEKKGMDSSQITGATSSYARKYALNGLFAIDDTKDADSQDNTHIPAKAKPTSTKQTTQTKQTVEPVAENVDPETFKKICFLGKNLGLTQEVSKQTWAEIEKTFGYTRGKWNAATKEWSGTKLPYESLRQIIIIFCQKAGVPEEETLRKFGLDALSDLSEFSDAPFTEESELF